MHLEGDPTKITTEDGRTRTYTYDEAHRLTGETHKLADSTVIFQHTYTYDLAGNRETKTYVEGGSPDPALTGDFTNELNQLEALSGTTGSKTDVVGTVEDANIASVKVYNRTANPDIEVPAQVRGTFFIGRGLTLESGSATDVNVVGLDKSGNEVTEPVDPAMWEITLDNTVNVTYTYDSAGCLSSDGTSTYHYDDGKALPCLGRSSWLRQCSPYRATEHRLIEVKDGETTVAAYTYDAFGRRLTKTVGATITRYIYSGMNVVEEYKDISSTWTLDAQYVHGRVSLGLSESSAFAGIDIDNVLSIERKDGASWPRWYYFHDGLGSVTELTDEDGILDQAYEYDAWGSLLIYDDEHASGNTYTYTGREWDSEIGLYYYRARHYAPKLGRFIQPDPAGFIDGPNLYAYVGGNPQAAIDPLGTWRIELEKYPLTSGSVDRGVRKEELIAMFPGNPARIYMTSGLVVTKKAVGKIRDACQSFEVSISVVREKGDGCIVCISANYSVVADFSTFDSSASGGASWSLQIFDQDAHGWLSTRTNRGWNNTSGFISDCRICVSGTCKVGYAWLDAHLWTPRAELGFQSMIKLSVYLEARDG